MKGLQSLMLRKNRINQLVFSSDLSLLGLGLSHLDLGHNQIESLPPNFGAVFPKLISLNLRANKLKSVQGLQNHQLLDELDVSDNQISKIPKRLVLPKLTKLLINGNALKSIRSFNYHFPALEVLEARHNQVMNLKDLEFLKPGSPMEEIYLLGNPVYHLKIAEVIQSQLPSIQRVDDLLICSNERL